MIPLNATMSACIIEFRGSIEREKKN
jgi:hypothetical protein